MSDLKLSQFMGRPGGKSRIRKSLYRFFPDNFKKYVEPFVGGGSVFLGYSFKPDQKIVINDLDKEVIQAFRIVKKGVSGDPKKYDSKDLNVLTQMRDKPDGTPMGKLASILINTRNTFGNKGQGQKLYKPTSPAQKLSKMPEYTKKMKKVTILNQDYLKVLSSQDSPSTFFYLDPPYEGSKGIYDKDGVNFETMAARLKKLKGKFMLSINDSANIRKLFSDAKFKRRNLTVASVANTKSGEMGGSNRRELIITNY